MEDINGRTAIITGVSKGIGLAIVHKLLEKGCLVCGLGRSRPEIRSDAFHFIETDIRQNAQIEASFQSGIGFLQGRLDMLINNAGLGYFRLVEEISLAEWDEMIQTNVNGMFYLTRLAVPLMKQQKSGQIVNISSIAGLQGLPEATGYSATKFAVRGFSQSLLKEVRKFGIRVSCVFPGSVNTDFFDHYEGVTSNETMLSPSDIASTVLHVLQMPPNADISEVEIRPLNARYR